MKSYSHTTGTFIGKGSNEIFFQCWNAPSPRGILVIAHGMGEHSGRYDNIIKSISGKKISVFALDHRGHGKSGGKKGHTDSFMDLIHDMKLFINFIKDDHAGLPLILLGHSMGGTVACKYALTYPDDITGLVLSSPGLVPAFEVPAWKIKLSRFLSDYIPGLTLSTGLPASDLSHDQDVVDAYENDPLVHDKISARFYTCFMDSNNECMERASELKMPLLVLHGKGDRIVDYRATEQLFNDASSKDRDILLPEDLYHETMNETRAERDRVLKAVSKWILNHLKKEKPAAAKKTVAKKKPAAQKKSAVKTAKTPAKKAAAKKAGTTGKTASKKVKKTVKKK